MKNNLCLQTSAGSDMMVAERGSFSCIHLAKKDPGYVRDFLPATVSLSISPANSIMKININEPGSISFYNKSMKQAGARLSEIEMALDCYDVSSLQFSIHDLKNLFLDLSIPAVSRLAGQMEELAKGNQFQEMKDLLREIKKIIGRIVKLRMQPVD